MEGGRGAGGGGNVNNYKSVHHPIPTKLSFQLSILVYSLLGKTGQERKSFFGGSKKGGCIVRLLPRALGS